jgi:hypothetical protein
VILTNRIPLTPEMPPKECADCAFLLDAIGIPYERRTTATGASLWVLPEHHARAARELGAFLRENRRPAQPPVVWPRHPHALYGVIGYALVQVVATLATVSYAFDKNWVSNGALDAGFLGRGEWWRVLTALTLHADMPHLLSNLVFGGLFGYPAARLFGPGLAWLLIVAGAGLAYGIDALLHPPQHYLLGASTAVFTRSASSLPTAGGDTCATGRRGCGTHRRSSRASPSSHSPARAARTRTSSPTSPASRSALRPARSAHACRCLRPVAVACSGPPASPRSR